MKVLNLLSAGGIGGIEQLCSNIAKYAKYDNTFCFMFEEGQIYKEMKKFLLHNVLQKKYQKKDGKAYAN